MCDMYEQFDEETINRALRRPFQVDAEIPPEFEDLLRRLDQPAPPMVALRARPARTAGAWATSIR